MPAAQSEERPTTYLGRRELAEEQYQKLYAKFRTHKFIDWGILAAVEEEGQLVAVPPYCYRFDESLAYWLSGCEPIDVPALMERFFPDPDELDCMYVDDLVAELERIATWGKQVYMTSKGSKLGVGSGVCWCYAENVARVKKWVDDVRNALAKKELHFKQATPRAKSAYSTKSEASLGSFLQNGFSVVSLNQLLIKLGILHTSLERTEDSKPRAWVSVIQALLDAKLLVSDSKPALLKALVQEYGENKGLPELRTIQLGYNPNNAQARGFYSRAMALLTAP